MLPMPGTASSSWPVFKSRLTEGFANRTVRIYTSFWLLGLINNVLYVIILSAALDLVGPTIPKSAVLLFDVIPSFFLKLTAPYYLYLVPYNVRVFLLVGLSACGMLLIALTPSSVFPPPGTLPTTPSRSEVLLKMSGVVLASLSSGAGEFSFLSLTHFYGRHSLAAWGSGTGGAGLVGAGAYALATTSLGLTVKSSLVASSFLPIVMLVSFFIILPATSLDSQLQPRGYAVVPTSNLDEEEAQGAEEEQEIHAPTSDSSAHITPTSCKSRSGAAQSMAHNLRRVRGLVIPYMLPLFLVYVAEYTINQGVAPTLLFPLAESPFKRYREFYPVYGALYQVGVFISRSSLPFIRINALYAPAVLQGVNLAALILHAITPWIPNVYCIFAIIFWEGLLGGLVYVSTFRRIGEEVDEEDKEFSLGAATASDSGGICVAGFIGMALETGLCDWQVSHGRDWCTQL